MAVVDHVVGGAAAEFWGPWKQTFQYVDQRVLSKGAVAVAIDSNYVYWADPSLAGGSIVRVPH